jgi:hypothetical protein
LPTLTASLRDPVLESLLSLIFRLMTGPLQTKLYDRTSDEITLDEVERIAI